MVAPQPLAARATSRRTGRLRKCLFPVLCLAGCLFLLPPVSLFFLQELEEQQEQQWQWQPMEPATLSKLRPPKLPQDTNNNNDGAPDGYFNGFPVHLRRDHSTDTEETPHSSVHCVGDNYQEDAWMERSCHFAMLCFDLRQQDFVLFQSHRDEVLTRFLNTRPGMKVSSALNESTTSTAAGVALGGINQKWQLSTSDTPSSKTFKWFPRVIQAKPGEVSYYALPSNTVLVPYHSLSAKNPGHLVWDDFLPIYTLLTMFQLQNRVLLPLRVTLPEKLWSSCEMSDENEHSCQKMTKKFAALLVGKDYPYNLTTANTVHFQSTSSSSTSPQSNYVCAPRGAAGLGSLTDHGTKKLHGWMREDYKITHNHGRGALLYEFRNFMLQNIGLPIAAVFKKPNPPFKIVFSVGSSDIPARNLDFEKQIGTLHSSLPEELVQVEAYVMKELSVQQQVKLASETAVFITMCGGGAVTGMFLPKGASVILYYLEHGGVERGVRTGLPAHLDWDLFNHLSHVRTHWMPSRTMDNRVDLRALVLLVQQELDLIQTEVLL